MVLGKPCPILRPHRARRWWGRLLPHPMSTFSHALLNDLSVSFPLLLGAPNLCELDLHRILVDPIRLAHRVAWQSAMVNHFNSTRSFRIQKSWPELGWLVAGGTLGAAGGGGESMAQSWPKNSKTVSSSPITDKPGRGRGPVAMWETMWEPYLISNDTLYPTKQKKFIDECQILQRGEYILYIPHH